MDVTELRDLMVTVCNYLAKTYKSVTWSVYQSTDLQQYAYRFAGIYDVKPFNEILCGYELTLNRDDGKISVYLCPCRIALCTDKKRKYRTSIICAITGVNGILAKEEKIIDIEKDCTNLYCYLMDKIKENLYPEWKITIISSYVGIFEETWYANTLKDALLQALSRKREQAKVDAFGTIQKYGKLVANYASSEKCVMEGYQKLSEEIEDLYCKEKDIFAVAG